MTARRRSAGSGRPVREGVRRSGPRTPRSTGRAGALASRRVAVLVGLGLLCTLSLAPHVRLYVAQERQKADLAAEIEQREASVAGLEEELQLWEEDAYVAAQARERLHYVFPGETGYLVAPPEDGSGTPDGAAAGPEPGGGLDAAGSGQDGSAGDSPDGPWYRDLWGDFEAGGE